MESENEIAKWEIDLANVINKTNRNIFHLSKTTHTSNTDCTFGQPTLNLHPALPIPPPMHYPSSNDRSFTGIKKGLQSQSSHRYEREANEAYHNSRGIGVTRLLPNHVEDALTTRIGHSIRRSIERTTNEKILKSSIRLDAVTDQAENLHGEIERIHKSYGHLHRTVSSQERVTKWLRKEAGCKKDELELIQKKIVDNDENKETIEREIDALKKTIRKHEEASATNLQLKAAINSIQTKIKLEIENAREDIKSEISSLRVELATLRNENEKLRELLKATNEAHESFVTTFDSKRIRDIVSSAVQPQICNLDEKIASTLKHRVEAEVKKLDEMIENKIKDNQKFWMRDFMQEDKSMVKKLSNVVLSILNENQNEISTNISKIILTQMLNTTSVNDCDHDKLSKKLQMFLNQYQEKHLKSTISKQYEKDLTKRFEDFGSSVAQIINKKTEDFEQKTRYSMNELKEKVTESAITQASGKMDVKLKNILPETIEAVIEPKLASINEKIMMYQKENACQKTHEIEKRFHVLSSKIDEFRHQKSKTEEIDSNNIKLLKEELKNKILSIQYDSEKKYEVIGEKIQQSFDSDLKHATSGCKKELADLNNKLHTIQLSCQTLQSSLEALKKNNGRIEAVEKDCKQLLLCTSGNADCNLSEEINFIKHLSDENKKEISSINARLASLDTEKMNTLSRRSEDDYLKIELSNEIKKIKSLIARNEEDIKINHTRFISFEKTMRTDVNSLQQANDIKNINKKINPYREDKMQQVNHALENAKYPVDADFKKTPMKMENTQLNSHNLQLHATENPEYTKKSEIFASTHVQDLPTLLKQENDDYHDARLKKEQFNQITLKNNSSNSTDIKPPKHEINQNEELLDKNSQTPYIYSENENLKSKCSIDAGYVCESSMSDSKNEDTNMVPKDINDISVLLQSTHTLDIAATNQKDILTTVVSESIKLEGKSEVGSADELSHNESNISIHTTGSGSLSGVMTYFDYEESIEEFSHKSESPKKDSTPNKDIHNIKTKKEYIDEKEPKDNSSEKKCTRKEEISIIYKYGDSHSLEQSIPSIDIEESLDSMSMNSVISKMNTSEQHELSTSLKSLESVYNSDFESEKGGSIILKENDNNDEHIDDIS